MTARSRNATAPAQDGRMHKVISLLAAAAAVTLAGCASSTTSTTKATTTTTTITATETLAAKITGKPAAANLNSSSNAPLAFGSAALTGPVPATVKPFTLTGNGNTGTVTWATTAGPLTVYHANAPGFNANSSSAPPPATWAKNGTTCRFVATFSKGTFKQVKPFGGKDGTAVSSAWHGNYVITAVGYAPLKAGQTACSFPDTGTVEASGAAITFTAAGTMTAKRAD